MKAKGIALLLALALFTAACGGGTQGPPSVPEEPPLSVSVREFPTDSAEDGMDLCLDMRNGRALFLDLEKKNAASPGGRNTVEADLATGEGRELGFWSVAAQWDGAETYYWVGMTGPVEQSGISYFGKREGPEVVTWEEWRQEGIWRGDDKGEGELIYLFPDNKRREIQSLDLWGDLLCWREWIRGESGGLDREEFCLLDLESLELRRLDEKAQFWVDGGALLSLDRKGILRAEDLATGEEFFNRWVDGCTRAFYRDGKVIWNEGAVGFHVYDCRTEKTRDLADPGAGEEEIVWELGLIRGRYLVYRVVEPQPEGPDLLSKADLHRGLRVFDLEGGEVIYRSLEDSRVEKRENWYYSQMLADPAGGTVLLVGQEHEPVEYWGLTGKGALSVFTLGE